MAEFLSKVSVQTSVAKKRSYDLSCQHVTTQTFMRPRVAYAKEFFPSEGGTSIKLNLKTYARLAAMLKPALGSIQIRNRVFFTPFRQVWPVFDEMLEQVPVAVSAGGSQIIPGVPYFYIKDWASLIFDASFGLANQAPSTVTNPDYINSNGDGFVLTADGRQFQNIMFALGYQLPISFVGFNDTEKVYSFLPILALAKTFVDWYFPAQYAHTGEFIILDGICQRNYQYQASSRDLWNTVRVLMYVFYDNDYFTSQWDTPVSPAPGVFGDILINDITNNGSLNNTSLAQLVTNNPSLAPTPAIGAPTNGTPFVGGQNISTPQSQVAVGAFTQFVDTALKKVTNAVMRHKLVGARVIDRMLVDYGVVTSYEQNKRSYYLGSQVFPVQISDVMSNSDTRLTATLKGEALGEYAGKGIAYDGDGNFEFDTKEFGMLFVINSVVPDVGIVNNVDRQCLHISRLDFFNPNYDGLGVMAVSKAEVYGVIGNGTFDNVFGFLPQYSDYKCGFDRLTGLYAFPSQRGGLDSWLTLRSLVPYIAQHSGATAHTIDFMRGSDAYQFCRLFYGYQNEEFDCIYLVHRINLKASMCCKPMYDTYEFDEDEGNKIMMQANGARLN